MSHLLDALNREQRAAVELTEGPILILAGAGSGKTRVITYRIAFLIEARAVPPESILAVTFTNKAADQMKARVSKLLPEHLETWPLISTFHSFCVRVLRRDIHRLAYSRDFSIYDEDDQERVVKASIVELGLSGQIASPRAALARISYAKNRAVTPEELYQTAQNSVTERLASVYELYNRKLRQADALDFDDLLLKTVALFGESPEVRDAYNHRFRYILVDEYQDTNRIQYQLIRQLTQAHHNLCVVGDEDQSIYRWRGAEIENILSFEKDYPEAKIARLEQNYRSTQLILDAATAVVSRNLARKGKTLWTERGRGGLIGLFEAGNAVEEGRFVVSQIALAPASGDAESIAVLYRTNAQSRVFEEVLRERGIDYHVVGGFSFYARAEVKDVLAYSRLANNLRDSAAFLRIVNTPPRGIGQSTLSALEAIARERKLALWEALEQELVPRGGELLARKLRALESFGELMRQLVEDRGRLPMREFFKSILQRTGYLEMLQSENTPEAESRIENLRELVNAAAEAEDRGETLSGFLDRAALVSEADNYDEGARVTLMTLHSAKGLEFATVFLAGLEEGLFPHKLSLQDEAAIEEERRLCYVGMTRAKNRLFLTWTRARRSFGREDFEGTRPSRFLKEIPPGLLEPLNARTLGSKPRTEWENALNSVVGVKQYLKNRGLASKKRPETQMISESLAPGSRWKLGTRVRHPKYGLGTILNCEGEGEDTKVTVSFPGRGRRKFVERHASLEKV